MTTTVQSKDAREQLGIAAAVAIVLAGYVFAFRERLAANPDAFKGFGWHPEAVLGASAGIQLHLGLALTALALGGVQMAAPKGTPIHRTLGWAWALLMVGMSGAALFIGADFTTLKIVALAVIGLTAYAVWQARRGNVAAHSSRMRVLYFGALFAVGLFTAIPGRATWLLFFSGH